MQVEIGGTQASVSDDGRDVQFAAPAGAGRSLQLPFSDASHARKGSQATSSLVSSSAASTQTVAADNYERAGAGIILCVILVAIAYKRFAGRAGAGPDGARSRLGEQLDDIAFLKRYGRGA